MKNKNNFLTPHHHDHNEIYIITRGIGYVYKIDKWIAVKKDDIFLFKSGELHCAKTDDELEFIYVFDKGPFNTIKYYMKSKL